MTENRLKDFLENEKNRAKLQTMKAQVIHDQEAIWYYNGYSDMIEYIQTKMNKEQTNDNTSTH